MKNKSAWVLIIVSTMLLAGAWLLVREVGPGAGGPIAATPPSGTPQSASSPHATGDDAAASSNGAMKEREDLYRMNLRLDSRIVDQDDAPLDGVYVVVKRKAPGRLESVRGEDRLEVSKEIKRDWSGEISLTIEFYKPGYESVRLKFMKPGLMGLKETPSTTRRDGKWLVHDEDIVLKKKRVADAPGDSAPITLVFRRYTGDWSISVHPEIGTMINSEFPSPDVLMTKEALQREFPPPAHIHLLVEPEFSFGTITPSEKKGENPVFTPPTTMHVMLVLQNAARGDGFVAASSSKLSETAGAFSPDDLTTAPETGYATPFDLPQSEWADRDAYHYFYYRAKGHYGKGYWTRVEFPVTNAGRTNAVEATATVRMIANPTAGDRNLSSRSLGDAQ